MPAMMIPSFLLISKLLDQTRHKSKFNLFIAILRLKYIQNKIALVNFIKIEIKILFFDCTKQITSLNVQ